MYGVFGTGIVERCQLLLRYCEWDCMLDKVVLLSETDLRYHAGYLPWRKKDM